MWTTPAHFMRGVVVHPIPIDGGSCANCSFDMKKAGPDQIPANWFRQQRLRDLQKWWHRSPRPRKSLPPNVLNLMGVERMRGELAALGLSFWLPRNLTRCIR